MHADLKGALAQIDKSWKGFTHRGNPMTKKQVKAVLEYGISQGYKSTKELPDDIVDQIISHVK